ncbi:MAG TPA: VapC toxin family PIN domain ribonuclease [Candidatus Eisenbacteria bacterium]|nr:VapC toxin family PIN domain ribonuclease [Candidatus Eisenbacteria bacterium]
MIAVDTGVLAWAANRYAPEHPRGLRALESLANGDRPWALPWPAVHRFLALVTHPHVVARALSPAEAWGFVAALAGSPTVRWLGETERHAAIVAELAAALPSGPLPPGFELAAVLREHGVRELLSPDPAMRAFGFLELIHPLREPALAAAGRRYRQLTPRVRT